jgi:hypothetical protein
MGKLLFINKTGIGNRKDKRMGDWVVGKMEYQKTG